MDALIKRTEVLTETKQMLRLSSTKHDVWLLSMISQRMRDLNTPETLIIKNCFIHVDNNRFYMPDDCKTLLAFRCKNSCVQGLFVDTDFFNYCCAGVGWQNSWNGSIRGVATINGRWVNFIQNWFPHSQTPDTFMYPNVGENTIEISYRAVFTDEEGDVVINEEAYTALASWVAYKFALSYPENYTPEQRREWKVEGSLQGNRVRSAAARRKFEQQRVQIANLMYTIVQGGGLNTLNGNFGSFYSTQYNSLPPSN